MLAFFVAALTDPQLIYLIGLVLAVFIVGVAAALITSTFKLGYLANIVEQHLLPTLLSYIAVAMLAAIRPDLVIVRDAVFGLLVTRLLAELFANLAEAGVPLPPLLTDTISHMFLLKSPAVIAVNTMHGPIQAIPVVINYSKKDPPLSVVHPAETIGSVSSL